jgi:hypothetical protein
LFRIKFTPTLILRLQKEWFFSWFLQTKSYFISHSKCFYFACKLLLIQT